LQVPAHGDTQALLVFMINDVSYFCQQNIHFMKRLEPGHLRPKLQVPEPTCPGRERTQASAVGGEHSKKEPFEQLVNSYSEHLHMSVGPVEHARDMVPPSACVR
jgi:hypothetical protein